VANVTYIPPPPDRLRIDGDFGDWAKYVISETSQRQEPGFNPNVDIIATGAEIEDNMGFFYIQVSGDMLQGDSVSKRDSFSIFIDSDNNPATGFSIRGMGADRVITIEGSQGDIFSTSVLSYYDPEPGEEGGWIRAGKADAKAANGRLEVRSSASGLDLSANSKAFFTSNSYNGWTDHSDGFVPMSGTYVWAKYQPAAPSTTTEGSNEFGVLTLQSYRGGSTLLSASFTRIGGATGTSQAALSWPGGSPMPVSIAGGRATFSPNMEIPEDGEITLTLSASPAASDAQRTLGFTMLSKTDITVSSGELSLTHAPAAPGRDKLSYVLSAPPSITIDGAFADWTPYQKSTSTGEASTPFVLDIQTFALIVEGGVAKIYANTGGQMMSGSMSTLRVSQPSTAPAPTPSPSPPPTPSPSPSPTPPPPIKNFDIPAPPGMDYLYAYIDADGDPGTGMRIGAPNGFGADYRLAITGKEGSILSRNLERYDGTEWVLVQTIPAEAGSREIEVGVALSAMANATDIHVYLYASSWDGGEEQTQVVRPMTRAGTRTDTRAPGEEHDLVPFYVEGSESWLADKGHLDITGAGMTFVDSKYDFYLQTRTAPFQHPSVMRVFIDGDSDPETGYWIDNDLQDGHGGGYLVSGIGAEYMVEVYGAGGGILSAKLYSHVGGKHQWSWEEQANVFADIYDNNAVSAMVHSDYIGTSATAIYSMSGVDNQHFDFTDFV
ncbi:MAG: hypothetical protein QCI38_07290, partial [Candidatus Thermoplasmatota archaeon]|nr:hypothetical protein [Candidatus Thermoplasmatota archaeon]